MPAAVKSPEGSQREKDLFHGGAVDPALLAKYAGKAHPAFIERYGRIFNDRPRMMGWSGTKPSRSVDR